MDPYERRAATVRRLTVAVGGVLVIAAVVLGVVGVITYTGGSDLGLLLLVAGLLLLTTGAGLVAAAVREERGRRR